MGKDQASSLKPLGIQSIVSERSDSEFQKSNLHLLMLKDLLHHTIIPTYLVFSVFHFHLKIHIIGLSKLFVPPLFLCKHLHPKSDFSNITSCPLMGQDCYLQFFLKTRMTIIL